MNELEPNAIMAPFSEDGSWLPVKPGSPCGGVFNILAPGAAILASVSECFFLSRAGQKRFFQSSLVGFLGTLVRDICDMEL